jgi:hypothetical protein
MKITKRQLKRIIREQAELVQSVQSMHSTDPELDDIEDIALDVVANGGALMQIATALQDQAFDANLMAGALTINGKYFIGKPDKFDIDPGEDVREVGPYVVGSQG